MGGVQQSITENINAKINNVDYSGAAKIVINSVTSNIVITATILENDHYDFTTNLTNCTCNYTKNYVCNKEKVVITTTANPGYILEPIECTQIKLDDSNKIENIGATDGVSTIWKVRGPVTLNATATPLRNAVKYNLTNCVSSETVVHRPTGTSYSTTITANDGFVLQTATCTMGSVDQTVAGGVINIDHVLGDIVITATATPSQP